MPTNNAWNSENPAQVARVGTGRNTLVAHSVLVGNNINQIQTVGPHAVTGIPLVSRGLGIDPHYGTAVVAGGGTGRVISSPYSVVCGGTAAQNPHQNVASLGTAAQVLTSNGPGVLPTWQNYGGGAGFGQYSFWATSIVYPEVWPTGDGTDYTLQFNTVYINNGGVWNGAASRFTAPVNGIYWFNCSVFGSAVRLGTPPIDQTFRSQLRMHGPTSFYSYGQYWFSGPRIAPDFFQVDNYNLRINTAVRLNAGQKVYFSLWAINCHGKMSRKTCSYISPGYMA